MNFLNEVVLNASLNSAGIEFPYRTIIKRWKGENITGEEGARVDTYHHLDAPGAEERRRLLTLTKGIM